ncbi:MAG: MoaD/ThiS family protein [Desulfurococcaceae archaeon TW002]
MVVVVRFYGVLRELVKERLELSMRSSEVLFLDLIKEILKEYPALEDFVKVSEERVEVRGINMLVNGRHIMFLGGDKALIRDGDVIDVLPPLHGG